MIASRTLTIASMAAPGYITFMDYVNRDPNIRILFPKSVTIELSTNGKTIKWSTSTSHIRIILPMECNRENELLRFHSAGSGWFILDGFPLYHLGDRIALNEVGSRDVENLASMSEDESGPWIELLPGL